MKKRKYSRSSVRVSEIDGEKCFAIADAAAVLGRSRPTLMRWAAQLRKFTGHAPLQDEGGRWFIPVKAVDRLQEDPELLKQLGSASTGNNHDGDGDGDGTSQLARVVRDVSALRREVKSLRADVDDLKRRAKTA